MPFSKKVQQTISQTTAVMLSALLIFGLPTAVFAQEASVPEETTQTQETQETTSTPVEEPCTSGCNQGESQGEDQGSDNGGPSLEELGGTYDEEGNEILPSGVTDTRQGADQGTTNGTSAAATGTDTLVSGSNSNTGSDSTNTATTDVSNTNTTGISNTATDASTVTASGNTGGNTNNQNTSTGPTTTGDASIGITQIKNDNTTAVGGSVTASVSGHEGDYNGDVTLDFENAASLLGGDGSSKSIKAVNDATGEDSTNEVILSFEDITDTEVQNDGVIANNVGASAITGQNSANQNTSNGEITTGDANVSATLVNLLNTTVLNGNLFVTVKDIFGNLTGDIIIPDLGQIASFLSGGSQLSVEADNSNTGADSTNTIDVDVTEEETFSVDNQADIDTDVTARAITGQNTANDNTGGGFIDTGDANVSASNITIANTTIEGGNWGLVIVNAFNKWLGFLVGDSGEVRALSQEETIQEIEARNSNTGSGSDNTIEVDSVTRDTTNVNNDAAITNNVDATAITGQNTANQNTGAGAITTGDANILTTAVNIANTTVKNANLGIAVVNIFGDWFGDLFYAGSSLLAAGGNNYHTEVEAENEQTGSDSDNTIDVTLDRTHATDITNEANISTILTTEVDTGNNQTNRNTKGGSIETGNSNLALHSRTIANLTALMAGGSLSVDVNGDNNSTGVDSENIIRATVNDERIVTVQNDADVSTILPGLLNTGNNEASDNTVGGDIESGDIGANVVVDNMINKFILALGVDYASGNGAAALVDGDLHNLLTGSGSINENDVDATREFLSTIFSDAIVDTLISLLFNTGGNQSNRNTTAGSGNPFVPASTDTTSYTTSSDSFPTQPTSTGQPEQYVAAVAAPIGYGNIGNDEAQTANDSSGDGYSATASNTPDPSADQKLVTYTPQTSAAQSQETEDVSSQQPPTESSSGVIPQAVHTTTAIPPRTPRMRLAAALLRKDTTGTDAAYNAPQTTQQSYETPHPSRNLPAFPSIIILGTVIGTLTGGAAVRSRR